MRLQWSDVSITFAHTGEAGIGPDNTTPPRNTPPLSLPPSDNPPPGTPPPNNQPTFDPSLDSDDESELGTSDESEYGIGTGHVDLLDTQGITVHLEGLKNTVAAIKEIGNASLATQFEGDDLADLRNPTQEELNINYKYFRLSLEMYLILSNVSQETYRKLVAAFIKCLPEAKGRLLSYDQIKRRVKKLTGIVPGMTKSNTVSGNSPGSFQFMTICVSTHVWHSLAHTKTWTLASSVKSLATIRCSSTPATTKTRNLDNQ